MSAESLFTMLKATGMPAAFGFFRDEKEPPYLVYTGAGQDQFRADNTVYDKTNIYQVEYYFTEKDEADENTLENAFLSAGFLFEKSADVYDEDQNVWVVYYTVWKEK